jgi:hypothetical protein
MLRICAFVILLFSCSAYAGCGTRPQVAWSVDTISGKKQDLGKGEYTECGNISGAFGGFSRGNFYVGWAVCSSNCETGFKPRATYVKLYDAWKPGVKNHTSRSTCVQQNGDTRQYCWNN